jgi:hypothetical protein
LTPEHISLRFISNPRHTAAYTSYKHTAKIPQNHIQWLACCSTTSTPRTPVACGHQGLQAASSSSIWSKCHTPALNSNNVSYGDKNRRQEDAAVFSKILTVAFADSSQLRDVLRDLLDGINLSHESGCCYLVRHKINIPQEHTLCAAYINRY